METNRLKQFLVLVETGHLRQAAEILHISHGGLHKSLRTLESELKRPLFRSVGKRIEITQEGKRLAVQIPSLLSTVEKIMIPDAPLTSPLRIGTFEVFSTYFLGKLIGEDYFSSRRFEVIELVPGEIEKAILDGRIDIGITYLPIPTAGVIFERIAFVKMGVYVRHNSFSNVALAELPFVVPARPINLMPTDVKGLDGWPSQSFVRLVSYEVDLMESGLEIVRQGKGAIFLPSFIAELHNETHKAHFQLIERPLPEKFPEVKRGAYLVMNRDRVSTRAEKVIARVMRVCCRIV